MTNHELTIEVVKAVAAELGCSIIDAITKMQAQAAKRGDSEALDALCEYKSELVFGGAV
jgi:hypothetical protein